MPEMPTKKIIVLRWLAIEAAPIEIREYAHAHPCSLRLLLSHCCKCCSDQPFLYCPHEQLFVSKPFACRIHNSRRIPRLKIRSVSPLNFLGGLCLVPSHLEPINLREMINGAGTAAIAITWILLVDLFFCLHNMRCSRQPQSPWWTFFPTNRYARNPWNGEI